MRFSPWAPLAAMWLIMMVVAVVLDGDWLLGWLCLACSGMSVLSAIVDRLGRREMALLRSISRIQAQQLRYREKGANVDIK